MAKLIARAAAAGTISAPLTVETRGCVASDVPKWPVEHRLGAPVPHFQPSNRACAKYEPSRDTNLQLRERSHPAHQSTGDGTGRLSGMGPHSRPESTCLAGTAGKSAVLPAHWQQQRTRTRRERTRRDVRSHGVGTVGVRRGSCFYLSGPGSRWSVKQCICCAAVRLRWCGRLTRPDLAFRQTPLGLTTWRGANPKGSTTSLLRAGV